MKKHWILTAALSLFALASLHLASVALADPSPRPSGLAVILVPSQPGPAVALLSATSDLIRSWGGLVWQLKISAIVMLLIASMKVTAVDKMVWDRLGKFQSFAAPVLGIFVGLLSMAATHSLSLAGALAYLSAGAGALLLHELLDGVKAWPGIGPAYIAAVDAIEGALGGNPVGAQDQQKPTSNG